MVDRCNHSARDGGARSQGPGPARGTASINRIRYMVSDSGGGPRGRGSAGTRVLRVRHAQLAVEA